MVSTSFFGVYNLSGEYPPNLWWGWMRARDIRMSRQSTWLPGPTRPHPCFSHVVEVPYTWSHVLVLQSLRYPLHTPPEPDTHACFETTLKPQTSAVPNRWPRIPLQQVARHTAELAQENSKKRPPFLNNPHTCPTPNTSESTGLGSSPQAWTRDAVPWEQLWSPVGKPETPSKGSCDLPPV